MDLASSPQEPEDKGVAGVLALDGLAPITIFVGANNSGKSRLMRELFQIQGLSRIKLKSRDGQGKEVDEFGRKFPSLVNTRYQQGERAASACKDDWIVVHEIGSINSYMAFVGASIPDSLKQGPFYQGINHELEKLFLNYAIKGKISGFQERKCQYIPMLRGMRPLLPASVQAVGGGGVKDFYEQRTIHDNFSERNAPRGFLDGDDTRNSIFSGLALYDDLRRRLLARTQAERKSVRNYEYFLSKKFFPGQSVTLIPVEESNNDVVHIKIGNKEERPIYDLGDGMQSLIICTYPIVTETEPGSLFFLEEPDLCMHPSLQRTFLEVLKTYHRKMGHQFFITTHSNHLLDLLEDNELVSIFSFSEIADQTPAPTDPSQVDGGSNPQQSKPKPSFRIRPSNLRDRQTLLELGVRPSATFLANATIWVEGVSDCAYLRAYMEAFIHYLKVQGKDWGERLAQRLEQYKEDRHYAFVEYNGSNLQHFSFENTEFDDGQAEAKSGREISVPDLCATAIVVADGDVRDKGDRSTWLEEQLKERFICLPGKEIENLIPESLMKRQINYDHTEPRRGDVAPEVIKSIAYASYAHSKKGVGAYLGETKNISKYQANPGEASKSGTLPSAYKTRWRSEIEGIPALLHDAISHESSRQKPEQNDVAMCPANIGESIQSNELPDYFTQDLIWLCVLLYSHIASCNHDMVAGRDLNEFKKFIEGRYPAQDQACIAPAEVQIERNESPAESSHGSEVLPAPWPIPDPSKSDTSRHCLLTTFLDLTSQPEAITNPHPEPQAQALSIPPWPTAYPAP
ncbi:AAA family ATPase [Vulcanococcus limneticus]|uniref:AAA family ATPase n=1 Tax=Vulcanococcus limneticus TaxID=2170428 RepID=UPI00398C1CDB